MMLTSVLVRAPHADDEPVWRKLWSAYLTFYDAKVDAEATNFTLRRILNPANPMFGRIAEREGAAVGFAICVLHEGMRSTRSTCYLKDLFVDPAARGEGVGGALLDDLVSLSAERGWSSIYWHTRSDNAQARRLYDRYVTADDFVRYRLAIKP